jgi:hypothetical protein
MNNLKTEDEARKLWCPHVRAQYFGSNPAVNANTNHFKCIASECSQWLWRDIHAGYWRDYCGLRRGYCGLTRERT